MRSLGKNTTISPSSDAEEKIANVLNKMSSIMDRKEKPQNKKHDEANSK